MGIALTELFDYRSGSRRAIGIKEQSPPLPGNIGRILDIEPNSGLLVRAVTNRCVAQGAA